MIQLGISGFYHDSAACIVKNGKVLSAAEEERFTEVKHDGSFPLNSIKWNLEYNGLDITDVDEVCWYEDSGLKAERINSYYRQHGLDIKVRSDYGDIHKNLKELGYNGKIITGDHHRSHAVFSYYTSKFEQSAILTIDGVGEYETITISKGVGPAVKKLRVFNYPNSLGLFYSSITAFLGFKPNEGEYKVMGLAPYGNVDRFSAKLLNLFKGFEINTEFFPWGLSQTEMFNDGLSKYLGFNPRKYRSEIGQEHKDLAAALQKVYELKFLALLKLTKDLTGSNNLCLGGGCAYNGVANSLYADYFENLHVPFAPSDAGSAIGVCFDNWIESYGVDNTSPFLGPEYSDAEILKVLDSRKLITVDIFDIHSKVASLIATGKIVAWFQGRMEFGARALGNRSILADPTRVEMKTKLNSVIKKRGGFRPFAPSVQLENSQVFTNTAVPYMSRVTKCTVGDYPAATHINGTCRVQTVTENFNPKFHELLAQMRTYNAHGVVLNTSFNLKDQTVTMTPEQAVDRFLASEIDYLAIGSYLVENPRIAYLSDTSKNVETDPFIYKHIR